MKKILIVIDYQNDFVSGSLGFDAAALLEDGIFHRVQEYRQAGWDVAFTFDTHFSDYLETREGRHLPIAHCIEKTDGWRLYGKVASCLKEDTPIFLKHTFGSLALANFVQDKGYTHLEFCGVVSNICVLSNAILAQAALPQAEISIDSKLIASNDPQMQEKALDILENLHMEIIR